VDTSGTGDGSRVSSRVDAVFMEIPRRWSIGLWSVVLVLVAVTAAADIQTPTIHAIRWYSFMNAAAVALVMGVVIVGGLFSITRDLDRSVRFGTATMITVFWWSVFAEAAGLFGVGPLSDAITVFVAVAMAVGIGYFGRVRVALVLISVIVGTVAVVTLPRLVSSPIGSQKRGSIVASIDPPSTLPNVLILVLDGHARLDSIESAYPSDGESFDDALESIGFGINPTAVSNYNRTYASVSSMLALDTLITDEGDVEADLATVRGVNGGDGELLRAFRAAGYTVTFSPGRWSGSRCGAVVDRCVRFAETRASLFRLFESSLLAPVVEGVFTHPWVFASMDQLRSIDRIYEEDLDTPGSSILWMHVILPHPPVMLLGTCETSTESWRRSLNLTLGDEDDERRIEAFVEQSKCVDTTVSEQMRSVVAADPNAVILIVSDHGPDGQQQGILPIEEFDRSQIAEKLSVLSAFKGPERCEQVLVTDSVLMAMRELTRCLLGAQVVEKMPSSYLVPGEGGIWRGEPPVLVPDAGLP